MKNKRGITRKIFAETMKQRWSDIAYLLYFQGGLRFVPVWRYPTPRRFILSQKGGGEISINDQIFQYNEVINSKNEIITIHGAWAGGYECFAIKFDIHISNKQKYAYLLSLGGHALCATGGDAKSTNIVRAAVELAREHGAQWIELSDNSSICKGITMRSISLADYYFITRGKTWYETILPFKPDDTEKVESDRNRVLSASWAHILKNIKKDNIKVYRQILDILPVDAITINMFASGSAMSVLRSVPRNLRCSFFYDFKRELMLAFAIDSLYSTIWWLPLTTTAQRPTFFINNYITVVKEE